MLISQRGRTRQWGEIKGHSEDSYRKPKVQQVFKPFRIDGMLPGRWRFRRLCCIDPETIPSESIDLFQTETSPTLLYFNAVAVYKI